MKTKVVQNIQTFLVPSFCRHSDIFSLQAFFLKIKMSTKNLVSDNVLIKIWVCKVRRNSLGRNIGSHNIIVPTTPQSLVPCSFVHNKSPHTFVGSSLVWEKVWKTIQNFFQNSRTYCYVLGRWGKVLFGCNTSTSLAQKELNLRVGEKTVIPKIESGFWMGTVCPRRLSFLEFNVLMGTPNSRRTTS